MPFHDDHHHPDNLQAVLEEIDGVDIPEEPNTKPGKELRRQTKCVAKFSDGSVVPFPDEVKFAPDNHKFENGTQQVRLRATPAKGPSILIPRGVTKQYILTVIERLVKGV